MLEQLRNYKTRKAIAKVFTKQCDMGVDVGVGANNVTITSTTPCMDVVFVTFTINGKDGESFMTTIDHGVVDIIKPVVPTYDHEVFFMDKNPIDIWHIESRRIYNTTMTRNEWLGSLHDSGVLDTMVVDNMLGIKESYSHMGQPIFTEAFMADKHLHKLTKPTYDHEVYFITKEILGNGLYASSRAIKETTMTRFEWLKSLHDIGVLDTIERNAIPVTAFGYPIPKMVAGQWEFSNLGHPIFKTYKEANRYATNANFGNVMKAAMGKIAEASKPKPVLIEVWGIKPISKEPVMLGAVDAPCYSSACHKLMVSGVGIILKRDFRTRAYFFYNGRPVFETKEAAQKCIDVEFGRGELFEIWGIECGVVVLVGAQYATSFDKAVDIFWHRIIKKDDNGRTLNLICGGKHIYCGHPVFETKSEAGSYLVDRIVSSPFTSINERREMLNDLRTKHNPLGTPLGKVSDIESGNKEISFRLTPTAESIDIFKNLMDNEWHGLWQPKKPTQKVSDLKCFDQLASVIGKGQAQVELFKVMDKESCWVDIDVDDFSLALDWALTPQGYEFWDAAYTPIRDKRYADKNNSCKSK